MYKVPIKPPIIVNESGDIDVFESVEDAEQYLERLTKLLLDEVPAD